MENWAKAKPPVDVGHILAKDVIFSPSIFLVSKVNAASNFINPVSAPTMIEEEILPNPEGRQGTEIIFVPDQTIMGDTTLDSGMVYLLIRDMLSLTAIFDIIDCSFMLILLTKIYSVHVFHKP